MRILAIDVGGTSIKYALFENGQIEKTRTVPTPLNCLDSFIKTIRKIINNYNNLDGIALSMPGYIDNKTGMIYRGGSLNYIKDLNIIKLFEKEFNLQVQVENDSKCASLAELKFGELKGIKNAIVLIFGTGIGGAVIINGKILRGKHYLAGEFSMIGTKPSDYCEKNMVGANLGISSLAYDVFQTTGKKDLTGKEIFDQVNNKDEAIINGVKNYIKKVVWLIYSLQVVLDPDLFLIGGGISEQDSFIKMIRDELKKTSESLGIFRMTPKIKPCYFRSRANLIGAVINYFQMAEKDLNFNLNY